MNLPIDTAIFVRSAEQVEDFKLRLMFSDGTIQVVDFGPFIQHSTNPLIRAYLDPHAFARFTIKDGDLVWDDYALCFPIADLYEGHL